MDDDMLIQPKVHHEVAPSGETDANGGGGYTFVFHDRARKGEEEDDEEAKKKEADPHKKFTPGPAVKLNLSTKALRKTTTGATTEDTNVKDPLERDDELEKNTHVGPSGGRLNIKV